MIQRIGLMRYLVVVASIGNCFVNPNALEAFNVFNHPNIFSISTQYRAANFGQALSAGDPRIMEGVLCIIFWRWSLISAGNLSVQREVDVHFLGYLQDEHAGIFQSPLHIGNDKLSVGGEV